MLPSVRQESLVRLGVLILCLFVQGKGKKNLRFCLFVCFVCFFVLFVLFVCLFVCLFVFFVLFVCFVCLFCLFVFSSEFDCFERLLLLRWIGPLLLTPMSLVGMEGDSF